MRRRLHLAALAAATLVASACLADAGELRVMSAGAVKEAVTELAGDFAKQSGEHVAFTFGTVGAIKAKLAAGETADVLILSSPALAEMDKSGALRAGSRAELGRIGMGVAVRQGAPLPDISTPDAFRKALLDARSIVYADPAKGASSGIYFAHLLERMGIADLVNRKATLLPGGYVVELVAKGGAELGVHNISEILPVKGVTLVGPLPAPLQHYTSYAAAVPATNADPAPAQAFIRFLARPAAGAVWKKAGVEPATPGQ